MLWSILFISFDKHMASFTTMDFGVITDGPENLPCRFCRQSIFVHGYRRFGRRHPKRPGMAQIGIITPQSGVPFIKLMTLMENWLILFQFQLRSDLWVNHWSYTKYSISEGHCWFCLWLSCELFWLNQFAGMSTLQPTTRLSTISQQRTFIVRRLPWPTSSFGWR